MTLVSVAPQKGQRICCYLVGLKLSKQLLIHWEAAAEFNYFLLNAFLYVFVVQIVHHVTHPVNQLNTLRFFKATGGDRRRTDPNTTGDEG